MTELFVVIDVASDEKYINLMDLTINVAGVFLTQEDAERLETERKEKGHVVEIHQVPELGVEQEEY